jgi:general secretion pathway protein A
MYKEFFGLQRLPFNLTPDPGFLFLPVKHREALAGLAYAILERKGFIVLTGDAGTGKTTLLGSVLNLLPADRILSSVILNPTLTPAEFLEMVLLDFDITDVPASKAQRLWRLQEFLSRAASQGKIVLLVIDEAHKLSPEVLEEIRLLGNYESAAEKFLQILLLGQSELDDLLERQDLRQFKQRIALRLYIDPLTGPEVEKYIRFRWVKAGGTDVLPFTGDAVDGIIQWSRGIPRLVNSLCDNALLMAYGDKSQPVGINYVREAATNLALIEVQIPPNAVPHLPATVSAQENHVSPKPPPPNASPLPGVNQSNHTIPNLAPYSLPRKNSSLLKRLAGKFGLP